ncbi:MAG: type 1 glutamine amidotransferase [Acidobacteria bacterium]|nr:type 1 glutamine amidotransferase [Acidobacteriota bacterium]MBI3423538.1 type 1 glutamine amidotransferase [Acidobacteriota bacterium]
MNIGLLQCDHVAERFQHSAGDYPAMFGALFQRHAPEITLTPFAVCADEWPAALNECAAYITTGSRFSVYDDVPWIHRLKAFVRQIHEAGKPYVGICFGHQMLAEALGGRVAKAPSGWGVGVHACEITQAESPEIWMQPPQRQCWLQYMHQDQVLELPAHAVVLGRSAHCPVAMFRAAPHMLGIQAHPEFTADYSRALLHDRRARIGDERAQQALDSLGQPTDEAVIMQWIAVFLRQATVRGA